MPIAEINGTTIHYEVVGEGEPLLFIHGGFGGLGTGDVAAPAWRDRFAQKLKVITYDRRSSGRSGFPETPHTMEQFADDVRGLLDHLGIGAATIWGTSAGGPIAATFALKYPERTARLILAETAPWFSRDRELVEKLRERIGMLESAGPEAAYEARRTGGTVGLNLFAADRPAQSEEEVRQREARRAQVQARLATVPREERIAKYAGELRTYSAYVDFDVTSRFRELRMPVLVVYGTADSIFPNVEWESLSAGMPNVTYLPVAGAEHGAAASRDDVLETIREFAAGPMRA
jgi:pimeloyl-ACP methyl ester carboxylesterase